MPKKPTPSWRDVLKIHPAAEVFPRMTPDELRALGTDIRKHGLREPITVMRQYRRRAEGKFDVRKYDRILLDGISRLDAVEGAGFVLVRDGKLDPTLGHKALGLESFTGTYIFELEDGIDPYAFVISANIHRRHLTAEQRRDLIAAVLKADPTKSDRQIAETVRADHKTVGAVRAQQEATGEISPVEKRVGKDRKVRKQPAHKPRTRHGRRKDDPYIKNNETPTEPEKSPEEKASTLLGFLMNKDAAVQRAFVRFLPAEMLAHRDDIGPNSLGESARKDARIGELENQVSRLEQANAGLRRRIAELERTSPPPNDDGLDIPPCLDRTRRVAS
jgi:hypothetical protein